MTANPILLQKKYSRVIECFAKQQGLSLDAALDFFYHSLVYQLIRDGVSDMHCMSDAYLASSSIVWATQDAKDAATEKSKPVQKTPGIVLKKTHGQAEKERRKKCITGERAK